MKRTFELVIGEQTIVFKWGTWAMKLFCDKRGISIDDFFTELQKYFSEHSSSAKVPLELLIDFMSAGYEFQNKKTVTDEQICDWIDDLGGITLFATNGLADYFNFIVAATMNKVTPLPSVPEVSDEEKKSEPGMTS